MRKARRELGAWAAVLVVFGGCAKGVASDSLTFGTPNSGTDTTTATTTGPIDPTTGGMGSMTNPGTTAGEEGPDTATTAVDSGTGPGEGTAEDSSTGPMGPVCGDDVAEAEEDCDGIDLAGMTCPDVDPMFTGGTLACDVSCAFDTTACGTGDNPIVMCQVVNGAIPDNSPVGLTDTITLPAGSVGGTITDVDIEVELDHTYLGDLLIDVSSGGTGVPLFEACSTEANLNVTFDDSGGVFSCASSDIGAVVQPLSSLGAFNGGVVGAEWTLFIEDELGADTGTLQQWCVTISWM